MKYEAIKVIAKGHEVTGITHISYNGIPHYDCIVELNPEQAAMVKIGFDVELKNTGDRRSDGKYKVVRVDGCNIYLIKNNH